MIPQAPAVLCADGLLAADLKSEFSRTLPKAGPVVPTAVDAIFAELETQAAAWFAQEEVARHGPRDRSRRDDALQGQGGELAVAWGGTREAAEAAFAKAHEELYGFALEAPIEVVTLRVEATGRMPAPGRVMLPAGSGAHPVDHRSVVLPADRPKCRSTTARRSERATASPAPRSSCSSTRRPSSRQAGAARCTPPERSSSPATPEPETTMSTTPSPARRRPASMPSSRMSARTKRASSVG